MGCASSKQQLKNVVANISERTNGTCTDSERTFTERTYCDKVNPSAMMTTATGEVAKIETERPSSGRHSPVNRSSKVGPTAGSNAKTSSSENNKHRRERKVKASNADNSKHRRESPPIQIRRSSKIDRSAKTCPGVSASLELDSNSNHSSRSTSEHSAVMFKANCDRESLAAALDQFDLEDFSNHTSSTSHYHEDPQICIVRSDKLAFSGAGIRRHSRRKRHRQLGKDNTKIVILRQPSFKEQAAMAAAEAEAEAASKANKELEEECAKQRSERQLSRANARRHERKSVSTSKPPTNNRESINGPSCGQTVDDAKQEDGTPVRSNSIVRLGSSSVVMMFEDKSEDLDLWPLPLTAVS